VTYTNRVQNAYSILRPCSPPRRFKAWFRGEVINRTGLAIAPTTLVRMLDGRADIAPYAKLTLLLLEIEAGIHLKAQALLLPPPPLYTRGTE
jgi:hypothetical protein